MSSQKSIFNFFKKKIKLIVLFESERLYINNLFKELFKFRLPIVFFYKNYGNIKDLCTYSIFYKNNSRKFHIMFLMCLFKFYLK